MVDGCHLKRRVPLTCVLESVDNFEELDNSPTRGIKSSCGVVLISYGGLMMCPRLIFVATS